MAAARVCALELGPRLRRRALDPGSAAADRGGPGRLRGHLLTEDNLPSYHHQLLASFDRDRAWRTWSHRWTAEEGRHAVVLRDYLLVTRNIDPVALERGRMATMQQGWMPDKTALG
jgi:acyl-[acyl-carrier-protein] desaturase